MYIHYRALRDMPCSPLGRAPQRCALFGASVVAVLCSGTSHKAVADQSLAPLISNEDAWQRLPAPRVGHGKKLPSWARMLAADLPQSTAALLELDLAQRVKSPVAPQLRAAMRWVSAHANRCEYAQQVAAFDAAVAGVDDGLLKALSQSDYAGWSAGDRLALHFARKMSVDSDAVTDEEFAGLVKQFGEHQVASMVLLMAYSNFQDRLLLCLGLTTEQDRDSLAPVEVAFDPEAFVVAAVHPPLAAAKPLAKPTGSDEVEDDAEWTKESFESLQKRLQAQREKPTRLRIPSWDEVAVKLPEGLMRRPSDIVWYRIVFGYAPELAVPYERFMRTAGAETGGKYDRIFGSSLFWVTTRAVNCAYCMGHCEMNWEVAGLSPSEIVDRSRLLAGNDWSSFPVAEQHAFAFARKLARTPGDIAPEDINLLKKGFGAQRALIVALHACRYHYMTRISNGFQLKLESENVFFDYWNMKQPTTNTGNAVVPLVTDQEAWKLLPPVAVGDAAALPNWAKAVAVHLPRTAAAMLELDAAHRLYSPLESVLRAKLRWVVAHANRCKYSEDYALADLRRAGAEEGLIETLVGDSSAWSDNDRDPLEFVRLLTIDAPTIPDALFERLRSRYGEKQVAAMVLLAAYGNFQDRIVLGLQLPMEIDGPLPPREIKFVDGALQLATLIPAQAASDSTIASNRQSAPADSDWSRLSYQQLQQRLEKQRDRTPRLPTPTWDDVKSKLPAAMAASPSRIVWTLTCYGYAPELAIPWSIATRTHWAESPSDRIFEESLFWVQTRAIECNYCMGHCEMLLEVAGLNKAEVAQRTRLLAESDWSIFPVAEQHAYVYARKLSRTPWEMTTEDYRTLESELGAKKAMAIFWWLCRGLYMTRVSDGFQLPLERDNVFASLAVTTSNPQPAATHNKTR